MLSKMLKNGLLRSLEIKLHFYPMIFHAWSIPDAAARLSPRPQLTSLAMKLHGTIDPHLPLLVVAVNEEADHLHNLGFPVLVTGAGKVNASVATAVTIATNTPAMVINMGTAGALVDGLDGIHEVGGVIQHDLDDAALIALTGVSFGPPIELGEGPTLATGDVFVSDPALRAALAERAHLVDMEGYAVAKAAAAAGVPARLVKAISDSGDHAAATSWKDSVAECAHALAEWATQNITPNAQSSLTN